MKPDTVMHSKQPSKRGQVILSLQDIYKSFKVGLNEVEIIKGVQFDVRHGEFIVLFGPSGCGKSTVLNILLGLEPPTRGKVYFLDKDYYSLNEDNRAQLRKEEIGMVYQQANWIRSLTVLENVCFPLTLRGISRSEREQTGWQALKQVEMDKSAYQIASELSSGQQQRVALARALIVNPSLIVADEPTGNLDSKASFEIMELFKSFNEKGATVILVTHDLEYLTYAHRSIHMTDGTVIGEYMAGDKRLNEVMVSKRGAAALSQQSATPSVKTVATPVSNLRTTPVVKQKTTPVILQVESL